MPSQATQTKESKGKNEMKQYLKPCPFCGGTDIRIENCEDIFTGIIIGSRIVCYDCLISFDQMEAVCQDDNVKAWNKRAAE